MKQIPLFLFLFLALSGVSLADTTCEPTINRGTASEGDPTKPKPKKPKQKRTVTYGVRADSKTAPIHTPLAWESPTTFGKSAGLVVNYAQDGKSLQLYDPVAFQKNQVSGTNLPVNILLDTSELANLGFAEIQKKLVDTYGPTMAKPDDLSAVLPRDYKMLAAYIRLSSQPDAEHLNQAHEELANSLTTSEKFRLVAAEGAQGLAKYNDEMAANTLKNYFKEKGTPYYDPILNFKQDAPGYVCRQIALSQLGSLTRLGIKNSYGILWNNGQNHVTVIAQNPDNPKELYLFNYGAYDVHKVSEGIRALNYRENYSTAYTITDANGRAVATLPSEMNTLVAYGAGMADLTRVDPMVMRPLGSVARIGFENDHSSNTVFGGRTVGGDDVIGVGRTTGLENLDKPGFSTGNTMAFYYQQRNVQMFTDDKLLFNAIHFSDYFGADYRTKWATLMSGGGFNSGKLQGRLTTDATVQVDGAISNLQSPHLSTDAGGSLVLRSETGAETKYESGSGNTKLNLRAATQFGVGTRDMSRTFDPGIYRNVSYIKFSGEQAIIPGVYRVTFDAAVASRVFGTSVYSRLGVQNEKADLTVSVEAQKTLQKDALTIAPGMNPKMSVEVRKGFKNETQAKISYARPLPGTSGPGSFQVGVSGSIGKKKKKAPKFAQDL